MYKDLTHLLWPHWPLSNIQGTTLDVDSTVHCVDYTLFTEHYTSVSQSGCKHDEEIQEQQLLLLSCDFDPLDVKKRLKTQIFLAAPENLSVIFSCLSLFSDITHLSTIVGENKLGFCATFCWIIMTQET